MFERYGIFFTPTGQLADFGASWLGWDSATATPRAHPAVSGIDVAAVTAMPRKYGFHGTLKAPFRMVAGGSLGKLQQSAADFAARRAAVRVGPLALRQDGGFVALRPITVSPALRSLAGDIVTAFDGFRAPFSDAEIARRRTAPLTSRQDQRMLDWGYPYVFDDFQFHLTLSGALPPPHGAALIAALTPLLIPHHSENLVVDAITLMGQDRSGMFRQIHRYALTG